VLPVCTKSVTKDTQKAQRRVAHTELVDNQLRYGSQQFHLLFSHTFKLGIGQFFQQSVRFAVQHAAALLNDSVPDGQRIVALNPQNPQVVRALARDWKRRLSRR
jgi:hypothetical protein